MDTSGAVSSINKVKQQDWGEEQSEVEEHERVEEQNRTLEQFDRLSIGVNMTMMKAEFLSWARDKQSILKSLSLELTEVSDTHLQFFLNDVKLQILIPSTYPSPTSGLSGEVFLVMTVGNVDDKLDAAVLTLNEKLERICLKEGALPDVLDSLLAVLTRLNESRLHRQCQLGKKRIDDSLEVDEFEHQGSGDEKGTEVGGYEDGSESECGGSEEDYNDDDRYAEASGYDIAMGDTMKVGVSEFESRSRGFLHALAEDARKACESAQRSEFSPTSTSPYKALMWCRVISNPTNLKVQLQFELAGIIDDRIAAGLNVSLDEPVTLNLEFSKSVWCESIFRAQKPLLHEQVYASQMNRVQDTNINTGRAPDDIDIFLEREARKSRGGDHKSYGLEILFPELTTKFFDALNRREVPGVKLTEGLIECVKQQNPFLGLAMFVSLQLKLLPNWCLVCWRTLPSSVTRMRTCDQDFCLFRFEELGLGVSVLQEVKNSVELVDLELSLACAAVESDRDVFEPFPAFLLSKDEIRGRSGWFEKKGDKKAAKHNKRFDLLRSILSSIPATTQLQQCASEGHLREVLTRAWYEHSYRGSKVAPHGGPIVSMPTLPNQVHGGKHIDPIPMRHSACAPKNVEDWAKERRMAYDVMRFVLITNRLSLRLLGVEEQVINRDTIHQFVVLHDTPEREALFTRRRAEAGGSFFAFHGSTGENWYSILRNGLRSMSSTSYMSTGAAYGEGIYFGGNLSTSLHYAKVSSASWDKGALKDGFQCLAICEIVKGSARTDLRTHSSRNIIVVPRENEQDVAIRFLLLLRPASQYASHDPEIEGCHLSQPFQGKLDLLSHYRHLRSQYEELQHSQQIDRMSARYKVLCTVAAENHQIKTTPVTVAPNLSTSPKRKAPATEDFCQQAPKRGRLEDKGRSTMVSRAVMQEFNTLMKAIEKSSSLSILIEKGEDAAVLSGITVDIPDESDICRWRVSLNPYLFRQSPLHKDLMELKRLRNTKDDVSVVLEVNFPLTYPFAPPFVRVLSPKFVMLTGHVTNGGSICMELLTASGWSPACSFESLLVQVVMAFIEGQGRVDMKNSIHGQEYQEHEAREAFVRAARKHGWRTP